MYEITRSGATEAIDFGPPRVGESTAESPFPSFMSLESMVLAAADILRSGLLKCEAAFPNVYTWDLSE